MASLRAHARTSPVAAGGCSLCAALRGGSQNAGSRSRVPAAAAGARVSFPRLVWVRSVSPLLHHGAVHAVTDVARGREGSR